MNRMLIVSVVFVFFASCSDQETIFQGEKENEWEKLELKGEVKSIKRHSYFVKTKDGEIVKAPKELDSFRSTEHLIFNKNGNKIEHYTYDGDGQFSKSIYFNYKNNLLLDVYMVDSKGDTLYIEHFKYDSNGNWIMKMIIRNYFYFVTRKLEYDTNGNLIHFKSFNNNEILSSGKMEYDENGNLLKEVELNKYGQVIENKIYKYNKFGVITMKGNYDANGQPEGYTYEMKYDDKNRLYIKDQYYFGEYQGKHVYEYNDKGHLSTELYYEYESDLIIKKIYNRDDIGNWINRTDYKNGSPYLFVEREIKYFD